MLWGRGSIRPHILHFGLTWRRLVNFTLRPLAPQKKPPLPTGYAEWVPVRTSFCTKTRKLSCPVPRIELQFLSHPASKPSLYISSLRFISRACSLEYSGFETGPEIYHTKFYRRFHQSFWVNAGIVS
jgi:hypothetical protein